jgi:hypothetical protein
MPSTILISVITVFPIFRQLTETRPGDCGNMLLTTTALNQPHQRTAEVQAEVISSYPQKKKYAGQPHQRTAEVQAEVISSYPQKNKYAGQPATAELSTTGDHNHLICLLPLSMVIVVLSKFQQSLTKFHNTTAMIFRISAIATFLVLLAVSNLVFAIPWPSASPTDPCSGDQGYSIRPTPPPVKYARYARVPIPQLFGRAAGSEKVCGSNVGEDGKSMPPAFRVMRFGDGVL